jgi:RND family efflux transporter MFP subunit
MNKIKKRSIFMRNLSLILIVAVVVFACTKSIDNQAQLQNLQKQKEQYQEKIRTIDASIAELEKVIIAQGGVVNDPAHTPNIKIETVVPVNFLHYIEVQGTVESDKDIFIPAESPGIVQKIYVKEGDIVKKDQVLAELDASILKKSIDEIKLNLTLANDVYERQKRLWDQKIGSEIQFLQAKNAKENLESRLSTMEEQYDKTRIKSPINGVVDKVAIKEGEAAAAGFGTIRVVQKSNLKIRAQVSEKYIQDIKVGDTAFINIPGINVEFKKDISAVSSVIDPETRTFNIEVLVPPDYNIAANNMLTVLKINDYAKQNATTVPVNVVQNTGEQEFIFVAVNDGNQWKVRKKIVKTGQYYNNRVEIIENLTPGEKIVIAGYQDLADGQTVNIVD